MKKNEISGLDFSPFASRFVRDAVWVLALILVPEPMEGPQLPWISLHHERRSHAQAIEILHR